MSPWGTGLESEVLVWTHGIWYIEDPIEVCICMINMHTYISLLSLLEDLEAMIPQFQWTHLVPRSLFLSISPIKGTVSLDG